MMRKGQKKKRRLSCMFQQFLSMFHYPESYDGMVIAMVSFIAFVYPRSVREIVRRRKKKLSELDVFLSSVAQLKK